MEAEGGQQGGKAFALVALQFQNAVFNGATRPQPFLKFGEKRRFAFRVKAQSRQDRYGFSPAAGFFITQGNGGLGHGGIFSNLSPIGNAATSPGFPRMTPR